MSLLVCNSPNTNRPWQWVDVELLHVGSSWRRTGTVLYCLLACLQMGQRRQTGSLYGRMVCQRLLDYVPEWKTEKVLWNMEFLKSLVPAVISGEGPVDHSGAVPRDTGPRLLSMKRLGLLVMGQTIDEDPEDLMIVVEPGTSSSRPASSNRTRLKGTTDSPGYWCSNICIDFVSSSCHS